MKRTLAILLSLVLLVSCLPLTVSAAKELSVEDKFRLLLSDINVADNPQYGDFYYTELLNGDSWTLIQGGAVHTRITTLPPDYGVVGNKLLYLRGGGNAPFKSSFGVYDEKTGAFYDLTDAWSMDFKGLKDTWNALDGKDIDKMNLWYQAIKVSILGDADVDNELTVLDATRMQRMVAALDDPDYFMEMGENDFFFGYPIYSAIDYDRDGDFTIMDATKLQRHIADLPNQIDYKLAWNERYFPRYDSNEHPTKYLINSLEELDLSDSRWKDDEDLGAEGMIRKAYKDDFFKKKSLLLLDVSLGSGSYYLTPKNVSIDKDGVLNVDFSVNSPQVATGDMNDRFICIELSKAFLDDVRDIKVNIAPIREKRYDYSMLWDERDSRYTGRGIGADMITEFSQIDRENYFHSRLFYHLSYYDSQPENRFRENAYLLINMPIGSTSYTIEGVELAIVDEILNVNVIAEGPEIGNAVLNTRFICVELSKDWLADSKDYKVNLEYDFTTFSTYRLAKNTPSVVENPDNAEIYLYNSRSDLNEKYQGHKELLDKYEDSFFENCSLVAIDYTLPHSTVYQFVGFSVEDLTMYADIYETKTNSEDYAGGQHVRYLFEISKSFLTMFSTDHQPVEKVEIRHIVTEKSPEIITAADVPHAKFAVLEPEKNGYTRLSSIQLYNEALDAEQYYSFRLNEMHEDDPSVNSVAAIVKDPHFFMDLIYSLPSTEKGSWTYEKYPPYCPYDLRFFYSESLVMLVHHSEYAGLTQRINGLYLKDGQLIVDAHLSKPSDTATKADTLYVSIVMVSKNALKNCTEIVVSGDPIDTHDYLFYSYPDNQDIPTFTYFDDPEEYQKIDAKPEYQKSDIIPAAEAKGRFEDSRWMALINNADQWRSLLPDLPLPTRPVVYLNGELQPSEESENPFDDYSFLVLDYLYPYKTGEITDVYSNGESLEVLIREDMIVGGSGNYVWHKRDILKIKKSELAGIESLRFLEEDIIIDGHVYNEITPYSERSSKPANLSGYTKLSATTLSKNIPGKYDYSWHSFPSVWVGDSDTGYTFLIDNTAVLRDFMPNADTKIYNEDYFRRYALIATVMQGYDDSATVTVGDVMKKDGTLYLDPGVSYHYEYDEDGMPISQPTAPLVWKVLQVSRADVDGITDIEFWK